MSTPQTNSYFRRGVITSYGRQGWGKIVTKYDGKEEECYFKDSFLKFEPLPESEMVGIQVNFYIDRHVRPGACPLARGVQIEQEQ